LTAENNNRSKSFQHTRIPACGIDYNERIAFCASVELVGKSHVLCCWSFACVTFEINSTDQRIEESECAQIGFTESLLLTSICVLSRSGLVNWSLDSVWFGLGRRELLIEDMARPFVIWYFGRSRILQKLL
jgi:hypothetical protein